MNFIIDIDGTLLNSDNLISDAKEFLEELNRRNIEFILMTNSIKDPKVQVDRFERNGVIISQAKILSPITAINLWLKENGTKTVKVIGTKSELDQIYVKSVESGYEVKLLLDFERSNCSYNEIQEIVDDLEGGVDVITASESEFYLWNGRKQIDTGAISKLCESITGKRIKNLGKPSEEYFAIALKLLNSNLEETIVVGDDCRTDIKGANDAKLRSILVKTGKYVKGDKIKEQPYLVVETLKEIWNFI